MNKTELIDQIATAADISKAELAVRWMPPSKQSKVPCKLATAST